MAIPINEKRKELHKVSQQELDKLYSGVSDAYASIQTKALALLAGEVAVLTFLFTAEPSTFPRPYIIFAIIIYAIGIILLGLAFVFFLWAASPSEWHQPPETKDLEDVEDRFRNDVLRLYSYLNKEYVSAIRAGVNKVNFKANKLKWGTYFLFIGIALIALIRFGGGTINIIGV